MKSNSGFCRTGTLDHYWGVESTLKRKQDITLYAPATYYPEDMALLKDKAHHTAKNKETGQMDHICKNDYPHTGKLVLCDPKGENGEGIYRLMPGVAVRNFDVPILLRVRGENVLYFNVKDKGVVTVTGCCHPGNSVPVFLCEEKLPGIQTLWLLWRPAHQSV